MESSEVLREARELLGLYSLPSALLMAGARYGTEAHQYVERAYKELYGVKWTENNQPFDPRFKIERLLIDRAIALAEEEAP